MLVYSVTISSLRYGAQCGELAVSVFCWPVLCPHHWAYP